MHERSRVSRREALTMALAAGAGLAVPGLAQAAAQLKMPMMADYFGALLNTSVVSVGLAKGYYRTPNVDVTDVVTGGGGGTAVRNMVGGNIDYGVIGTSGALTAIRQGVDIRIVHGAIRTMEDLFWVSMPNSGIKSIQDLKGKKVGFTKPRSISETMAKWKLRQAGLEGKVQLVSLGGVGAGLAALESGGVDAALILEPLWSARKSRYQIAFTLSELPAMSQMVGVASGRMIREHPEALRDLVHGWTQSVNFTYEHTPEAAQIIAKRYGPQALPPDVALPALESLKKIHYWSPGEIDIKGMSFWIDAMREQGEWEGPADLGPKVIDQSFLPKQMQRTA